MNPDIEPMLLLEIADERRRRLMEEAAWERLAGRPPASKRLAEALRAVADHLDASKAGGAQQPSLP